ncbi:MAG: NupC/NupG family nucleoside CNT transporter [Cyanobacteria bacterium SIG30]|nr:NupC/NupG family nucleoside CNT transporter [Cyanobacteria bacterium SIG30]
MERFTGLFGIILILSICFLMSNNRKKISYKTIISGLLLQFGLAVFILKVPLGQLIIEKIAVLINKILEFSDVGGDFVFGFLNNSSARLDELFYDGAGFIFAIKVTTTIIFVLALVNILYHLGIMQRIVAFFAKLMYKIMDVSGAEALSNIASAFVGQVEAQIMIRPYLKTLTKSELLASMTGSMACIAGGVMAIYIALGIPAKFLLAASIMAAPGALVIAKIVYPEVEMSKTKNEVKVEIKKDHVNLIDAIATAASDGMKVGLNVIAMLVALLAIVAMIDWVLGGLGSFLANNLHWNLSFIGIDLANLSLKSILGSLFSLFALSMGVPLADMQTVGALMGEKLVLNEFIAYLDLIAASDVLNPKSVIIASFALCGFANFGSIAIQIGGIGGLEPSRREDLAKLGVKALICGTFASYISACMAGILLG